MDIAEAIIAGLGIVGTLAGVVLGYLGARQAVSMQLEHQDRTRYQERRLDAYLGYVESITTLQALQEESYSPDFLTKQTEDSLRAYGRNLHRIKLCASKAVLDSVRDFHELIAPDLHNSRPLGSAAKIDANDVVVRLQQVEKLMREELGIDRP